MGARRASAAPRHPGNGGSIGMVAVTGVTTVAVSRAIWWAAASAGVERHPRYERASMSSHIDAFMINA